MIQAPSKPPGRVVDDLVRRVALDAVLSDPADPATARSVRAGLEALVLALRGTPPHGVAVLALASLGAEGSEEERSALADIGELLDRLQAELAKEPSDSASAAVEPARAGPAPSADLVPPAQGESPAAEPAAPQGGRDPEMAELFVDFVAESVDGLDRADAILLASEQGTADNEKVNALFRVFHTIKGVSGFLSVPEVTRLAHVTEALLDQVRQGKLELTGLALDAVFDSSASMRQMLLALQLSASQGLPDPSNPELPALIARIERATSGVSDAAPSFKEKAAGAVVTAASSPVPDTRVPTAPAQDAAPAGAQSGPARVRETVKVDIERVDSIVEMVGELIIVESMIVNAPELNNASTARLRNYLSQMTKISRDLQSAAMRMRMVPVSGVFRKMARLVRDLSHKTGKLVQMQQTGEATEMDRSMVERIEDPLVHMIRNAMDHAIELPDERRAAGKPAMATIHLSASHEGGSVAIQLRDDGRGLPREKILKKARERGVIPDSGETLSDQDVYSLIFIPGFSTASQVTEISGRGVGMDVVKRSVEDLRGRVLVESTRGQGTTFKLILPLTLAIIDGMLVSAGNERYIIPSLAIIECLQPTRAMVHALGDGTELIGVRGEILPLLRLGRLFSVPGTPPPVEEVRCVILESAGRKLGLLVDEILTQQQVVIKTLGEGLGNLELLAGAAILPDGRVGLILNVDRLAGLSGRRRRIGSDSGEVAA